MSMLGKLGNMGDIMRQAKEMKSKMDAIQKSLSAQRVAGDIGLPPFLAKLMG